MEANTNKAYQDTIDYLYAQLPMFSRIGSAAIKKDLDNTIAFCSALDHPEKKFKSIHIAGTNGKGSTSHMLAAILQNCGYKVGLYTSPHLVDFRERIRINGEPIQESFVTEFVATNKQLIESISPSFFEITVAMAFYAFAQNEVDYAIIETGLGGRLDSTNVITPILSIITNISYDHTDMLGNTLAAIAREKAGIIKPNIPVVIGEYHEETEKVFFETSVLKHSTLYHASGIWDIVQTKDTTAPIQAYKAVNKGTRTIIDIATDMLGKYQQLNLRTVLTAVDVLRALSVNIPQEQMIAALQQVKKLTGLRGRWDVWQQNPMIVSDVAHNPAGLQEVLQQWSNVPAKQKHIIIGFVKDKDVNAALDKFPKDAVYYCTQAAIPRALPYTDLYELAIQKGLNATAYPNVAIALNTAKNVMNNEDALLITGSFFIVGEAMTANEHG